ncbi:unnamed protein product [Dimorphilus gyrociliatus]|uniref:Uncharacterized protein n=1 Tax=Dimorphilus gyrociliatus TaxID=2664684 RepID=A0A7I8W2P1_9ANNE|nr:unnamed protein product [Dimorphilus gyrociliatus]
MTVFDYLKRKKVLIIFVIVCCYPALTKLPVHIVNLFQIDIPDFNMEQEDSMNYCRRPELKLWPRDVRDINTPPKRSVCKSSNTEWIQANNGILRFTKVGLRNRNKTICNIHIIDTREDSESLPNMFRETFIIKTLNFKDGMNVPSDIYSIKCSHLNQTLVYESTNTNHPYENLYLNIKRHNNISLTPPPLLKHAEPKWNILIWCFDSLSKLSWHRYLPETVNTFEKFDGIWMKHMNALGKASITNIQPLLTGTFEKEVHPGYRTWDKSCFIDNLPWIWNPLKKLGYATLFGDCSTFNRRYMGFEYKPTHHYIRPWMMQVEKEKHKHERYCINSKKRISIIHDYIKEFWDVYKDNPKFAFVNYKEMSYGNFVDIQLADKYQKIFLEDMKSSGKLDNTIVIFMSDHGTKRGIFKRTKQSNYELLNPYFGIIVPTLFKLLHQKESENLLNNIDKMITPFDVHAMLSDIVDMVSDKSLKVPIHPGSISLFNKIKHSRKCAEANIKQRFCSCNENKKVNVTDDIVDTIANLMIKNITERLKPVQSQCSKLKLLRIHKASLSVYNRLLNRIRDFKTKEYNYNIKFIIDQVGVMYDGSANVKIRNKSNRPFITITNINRYHGYGNYENVACLSDEYAFLSPFCFCK